MSKSEAVAALKSVPIFEGLSKKELDEIFKAAKEVHFPAGKTIVAEGDTGAAFHLILEGTVTVSTEGGASVPLGAGDYFGEMSLIDHQPRSASVTAQTDVRTLSVASWSFLPILDEMPSVARKMLVVLSQRLRATEKSHRH